MIFLKINYTLHFFASLLGERYCITVSPCLDIIWGTAFPTKYLGERRSPRPPSTTPLDPTCGTSPLPSGLED